MASTALELMDDADLTKRAPPRRAAWSTTLALAFGALGVIYGDIGTSPLYVYSTIFSKLDPSKNDVLGAVSLIFWTITLIVLVKYVGVVLLADDDGEGGTFSLYAFLCRRIGIRPHSGTAKEDSRIQRGLSTARGTTLIARSSLHRQGPAPWWRQLSANGSTVRGALRRSRAGQLSLWGMTVVATGMVLGDGVLTPAISVMSAVSGLKEATPAVTQHAVVGISIAILVLLYSVQQLGTHRVSFTFAPVVALWLTANLGVAIYNISRYGGAVFAGLSPHHIVLFFSRHGTEAWRMLGGVMLCVTGAEAMYADLGHFSHGSIVLSFSFFVYPCLVLTYLGQGAFLMARPEDVGETFWKSVPRPFFYPMLVLATLASVVASQALITGSFSIVANAIKLGAFPKLHVQHTSASVRGQIYVGEVNWALMLLCIACVAGFQDTVALGNAYGLTVSSVFLATTALMVLVMVAVWELSLLAVLPFAAVFLLLEGAFVSANLEKIPEGAWFTLVVSGGVSYIMIICESSDSATQQQQPQQQLLQTSSSGGNAAVNVAAGPSAHAAASASGPASVGLEATAAAGARPAPNTDATGGAAAVLATAAAGPPTLMAVRAMTLARLSSWRPTELAMRQPSGELRLLTRQPGVGLYYSESPVGLPSVLLHFLRNVHSVHDVSVFVTVRIMPLPHVQPRERLLVRQMTPIPNFYQVVARYGYLDKVDHGPSFVTCVVDAIVRQLRRGGQTRHQAQRWEDVRVQVGVDHDVDEASDDEEAGQLPPLPVLPPDSGSTTAAARGTAAAAAATEINASVVSAPSPVAAPVLSPSGGSADGEDSLRRAGGAVGRSRQPPLPAAAHSAGAVDQAAVAHILEACNQGVVYYLGVTRVRPDPSSRVLHQLLFGAVYRLLLGLSHSEVEEWQLPEESVVELGVTLRI
ncbi:hypothetical protein GPECTOR_318g18 [Gonium pectorale]|uniref:Potassium transporter n=1 Tax=Gonium pectorale TaxID=33097 RepID=A0A150FVQ4_GONPE|nr:hypothetical protein GPECTOR_318g18 [Gonium pectorale]|eukprot:KXZ41691.1 hypothetical protein GPECTOR_318g18 [Gonium pectorale]